MDRQYVRVTISEDDRGLIATIRDKHEQHPGRKYHVVNFSDSALYSNKILSDTTFVYAMSRSDEMRYMQQRSGSTGMYLCLIGCREMRAQPRLPRRHGTNRPDRGASWQARQRQQQEPGKLLALGSVLGKRKVPLGCVR